LGGIRAASDTPADIGSGTDETFATAAWRASKAAEPPHRFQQLLRQQNKIILWSSRAFT
jgi:hypothetical protein